MKNPYLLTNRIPYLFISITLFLFSNCSKAPDILTPSKKDYCGNNMSIDSTSLSDLLKPLSTSLETKTAAYVLEDGGSSLISRAWFTDHATKSIDIQYFIFSTDNIGLIACDYLVKAADRGVKVRIIIDDIMVNAELKDLLMLDAHENINIKIYNPGINLGKSIFGKIKKLATDFRSANQRMHNKTFIVDDQVAITGGRNIADEYFDYDHEYNFRDRDVLLIGDEIKTMSSSFEDFWTSDLSLDVKSLTEDRIAKEDVGFSLLHQYACNPVNFWPEIRSAINNYPIWFDSLNQKKHLVSLDSMRFVSDVPGKNDGSSGLGGGGLSTDALIDLIQNAEKSIDIQTPYLITTELSRGLFEAAFKRGVKIRILTNSLSSTDNVEAFSSYQTDREDLLNTGVKIYEFKPDAAIRMQILTGALQKELAFKPVFGLHAKTMVIDDNVTVVGTFNLDPRSANLNTECIAIMYSEEIAKGVLNGMEAEILPENAWETTLEFNPDDQVSRSKRVKTWTRKVLPKAIL